MLRNEHFFRKVWPVIGPAVTGHRAGDEAELLPLLRRLRVRRGARVLDVPCGYGRHALLLARRGYRVTGVDFGPELLAIARAACGGDPGGLRPGRVRPSVPGSKLRNPPLHRQALAVRFIRGNMQRLRFRGAFDLLLNLFTSFGYFGDREDQRVLESFHRALRPGGWLVMHLINRDYIVRHYKPLDRARLPGFRLEQRARMEWTASVIHAEWIARFDRARLSTRKPQQEEARSQKAGPRVLRGATHLRIYSCHELTQMLERAGFRRVQAFSGFRGEPVSMDQRWLVLVAQR